jgi:hypothetical protein
MQLKEWAAQQGIHYQTAWKWFRDGKLRSPRCRRPRARSWSSRLPTPRRRTIAGLGCMPGCPPTISGPPWTGRFVGSPSGRPQPRRRRGWWGGGRGRLRHDGSPSQAAAAAGRPGGAGGGGDAAGPAGAGERRVGQGGAVGAGQVAAPLVVAPPGGARIRTRLGPSAWDAAVVRAVGEQRGRLAGQDLRLRCQIGPRPDQRTIRKQAMTAACSSRWAGAITRTSNNQWERGLKNLLDARVGCGVPPASSGCAWRCRQATGRAGRAGMRAGRSGSRSSVACATCRPELPTPPGGPRPWTRLRAHQGRA